MPRDFEDWDAREGILVPATSLWLTGGIICAHKCDNPMKAAGVMVATGVGVGVLASLMPEPPTRYDVVLKLESLSAFANSGRITTVQGARSLFDMAKEEQCRIIAFVGLFDKGKTFLINKLLGISLPSGSGVVTKGLSFVWVKERGMLILDSAGMQAPVKYTKASASDSGVETIADAQNTESLIFDLISRLAHKIVFVVDNLTWLEQKYIQMLHNKYIQREQHRELIVVHNLRSVVTVDDAKRLWQQQVLRNYEGGRSSHLAALLYTENRGEGVPGIHHFGMCAEGSHAGNSFNASTRLRLMLMLEMQNMTGSKFVLKDALVRELRKLMPQFFKTELTPGEVEQDAPHADWVVEYQSGPARSRDTDDKGYVSAGEVAFRTQTGAQVLLRNEGRISPLGDIITFDSNFDPPVYVYDKFKPRRRYIKIECPGVDWENISYETIGNGVRVDIEKPKIHESKVAAAVKPLRQKYGRWQHDFAYNSPDMQGTWEVCHMKKMTLDRGVFTLYLWVKSPEIFGCGTGASGLRAAVGCEPDPEVSSRQRRQEQEESSSGSSSRSSSCGGAAGAAGAVGGEEPKPNPQQQPQPQRGSPWQPPVPPGDVAGEGAALARAAAAGPAAAAASKVVSCLRRMVEPTQTRYDVVLKLESLSAFAKSGRIETTQAAESLFDMAKEEQCRIIAFVGLFDKGKTFLINRLLGIRLPSGSGVVTKGLSFFWVKERSMLILDSAGVQAPVEYTKASASDLGVETIADAQNTESLIFDLISRLAHRIVFVVDNLTWLEQKYIQMLHNKYIQREKQRELIVVHNLRSVVTVADARRLWQQQVLRNYEGGRSSHLAELLYTENRGEGVPDIHHFGMCAERSKAGESFNERTCCHLNNMLEMHDMTGSKVVLKDALVRELRELLPLFLKTGLSPDNADQEEPCADWHVEYQPGKGTRDDEGYVVAGAVNFRIESGVQVILRNEGTISPLGDIITFDSNFDPPVYVYDDTKGNRQIMIECPGVELGDILIETIANGVKVTIEKRKLIDESEVKPLKPLRQKNGRWVHDFAYNDRDRQGTWEVCDKDDIKLELGVLTLFLRVKASQRIRCAAAPQKHPAVVAAAAVAGAAVQRASGGTGASDAVGREPDPEVGSSPARELGSSSSSTISAGGAAGGEAGNR